MGDDDRAPLFKVSTTTKRPYTRRPFTSAAYWADTLAEAIEVAENYKGDPYTLAVDIKVEVPLWHWKR